MKFVKEAIGDVFKPKTEEEINYAIEDRVNQLYNMSSNEMISDLAMEFDLPQFDIINIIMDSLDRDMIRSLYKYLLKEFKR
jgi:hypothetical protein